MRSRFEEEDLKLLANTFDRFGTYRLGMISRGVMKCQNVSDPHFPGTYYCRVSESVRTTVFSTPPPNACDLGD